MTPTNHLTEDLKEQVIYLQQRVAGLTEAVRGAQKGNLRQHNKIIQLKQELRTRSAQLDNAIRVSQVLKSQLDEMSASNESSYAVRRAQELTEMNDALIQRNNDLEEVRLAMDAIIEGKDVAYKKLSEENSNLRKSYTETLNKLERENAMLKASAARRKDE